LGPARCVSGGTEPDGFILLAARGDPKARWLHPFFVWLSISQWHKLEKCHFGDCVSWCFLIHCVTPPEDPKTGTKMSWNVVGQMCSRQLKLLMAMFVNQNDPKWRYHDCAMGLSMFDLL
jgi:hypothetical protein